MPTATIPAITPEVIREHGLTPDEFEKIKQLLGGREPTITELGIFSVMWSEHCSYKSSRVHEAAANAQQACCRKKEEEIEDERI